MSPSVGKAYIVLEYLFSNDDIERTSILLSNVKIKRQKPANCEINEKKQIGACLRSLDAC